MRAKRLDFEARWALIAVEFIATNQSTHENLKHLQRLLVAECGATSTTDSPPVPQKRQRYRDAARDRVFDHKRPQEIERGILRGWCLLYAARSLFDAVIIARSGRGGVTSNVDYSIRSAQTWFWAPSKCSDAPTGGASTLGDASLRKLASVSSSKDSIRFSVEAVICSTAPRGSQLRV